jgi:hypothetical protein
MDDERGGPLPLAADAAAASMNARLPAYLARPDGLPIYHGFPILESVQVDGFTLGLISDSVTTAATWGDAFVVAPDRRRAGLVWEVGVQPYFETLLAADANRWGVFGVGTARAPTSLDDAKLFLNELLPSLRSEWERTRANVTPHVPEPPGDIPGH